MSNAHAVRSSGLIVVRARTDLSASAFQSVVGTSLTSAEQAMQGTVSAVAALGGPLSNRGGTRL